MTPRGEIVRQFRARLREAMARQGLSQSALARAAGIDRSTLSQLLDAETTRLPRADTAAQVAAALQVSLDWLLGLSQEPAAVADILEQAPIIERAGPHPVDDCLVRWHDEAVGFKIRYVPMSLPDVLKTDEVLDFEYAASAVRSPRQASALSRARLDHLRLPETEMEICSPRQALEAFARGEERWRGLAAPARRRQLVHMAALVRELYPTLRWFLFDGLTRFAAPLTIFGPQRAALYIGQMYFVFTTTEHIRVLTRHFEDLIRAAVVQPPELPDLIEGLIDQGEW